MKNPELLKKKIQALENQLRQKDLMIKKYRQSLKRSSLRIQQIGKELNDNFTLVREIHKKLLPLRLPQIPGFEFSYKFVPADRGVSGDFFDVIKIKDSMSFGVLLFSCESYSLSSLFLSSFLRLKPQLKNYKSSKELVSFIFQSAFANLKAKEKVHLFYGLVSSSSLEMDYCLSGNIFAGYKNSEGSVNELSPQVPVIFKRKKLSGMKRGKLQLKPLESLLFCSPGVATVSNTKGEEFSKEGIVRVWRRAAPGAGVLETRQAVLFACSEFGKKQAVEKDRAILALRVSKQALRVHK